jgi:hypothetical protein
MALSHMSVAERKELRERTHIEIAMSAAVAAGLAPNERSARQNMEKIIAEHPDVLKAKWLRERGGGIKGWLCFLRTYGFEEKLQVRRIAQPSFGQSKSEPVLFRERSP